MRLFTRILHIIMVVFAGAFIGRGLYVLWRFHAHPALYAAQSAPWYTGMIVHGAFTLALLLICLAVKALAACRQKRK